MLLFPLHHLLFASVSLISIWISNIQTKTHTHIRIPCGYRKNVNRLIIWNAIYLFSILSIFSLTLFLLLFSIYYVEREKEKEEHFLQKKNDRERGRTRKKNRERKRNGIKKGSGNIFHIIKISNSRWTQCFDRFISRKLATKYLRAIVIRRSQFYRQANKNCLRVLMIKQYKHLLCVISQYNECLIINTWLWFRYNAFLFFLNVWIIFLPIQ